IGRHWAEDLIMSFGLSASAPSHLRLHGDGAASLAALFETFAAARARLDICTYILGKDPIGREIVDGLIARLHAAGIETAVFSPLLARSTSGPRNLRNHRKYVIADEATLWAGGRNLAAEY